MCKKDAKPWLSESLYSWQLLPSGARQGVADDSLHLPKMN